MKNYSVIREEEEHRSQKFRDFRKSLSNVDICMLIEDEMLDLMDEPPFTELSKSIGIIFKSYVFDNQISFEEACEKSKPFILEIDRLYYRYKKLIHLI